LAAAALTSGARFTQWHQRRVSTGAILSPLSQYQPRDAAQNIIIIIVVIVLLVLEWTLPFPRADGSLLVENTSAEMSPAARHANSARNGVSMQKDRFCIGRVGR